MKKTIFILTAILLLSSCSKEEIKQTNIASYSLNGHNQNNSKLVKVNYDKRTEYIQYNFRVNDTTFGGFVLSTESSKQYCFSFTQKFYSTSVLIENIVDNKMQGNYTIVNGIVNGRFTGTTGNYIEFKNYKL
jgi:uncharacterized membrane protein